MIEGKSPALTVDIIIELPMPDGQHGIILIKRKFPPYGWAIPGGFVDYGERVENAAIREAKEETNLDVSLSDLLGIYSDPSRDNRGHTASVVYIAHAVGVPTAQDDALAVGVFTQDKIPADLAFDHNEILADYFENKLNQ
jgi:ADP-ribose pyrophosphatase YjhB (NUDIX family)